VHLVGDLAVGPPGGEPGEDGPFPVGEPAEQGIPVGLLAGAGQQGNELGVRSGPGSDYASFQDLAVDAIAELVRRGIRTGEFGEHLDLRASARAIFAWIVGMDSLSLLESDADDLLDRTDELLALLIPALTARPQPKAAAGNTGAAQPAAGASGALQPRKRGNR
jgi:hypothetical protein